MNTSLDESVKDLIFLKDNNLLTKKNKDDIWTSRANDSQDILLKNLENTIENFRKKELLINENPRFRINFIDKLIPYKFLVYRSIIEKYNILNSEEKNLLKNELTFSHIGNPYFINYDRTIFNKRWIHNIHYTFLIKKYLMNVLSDDNSVIIDIGGGYGILGHMLNRLNYKGTYILVEYPEQLIAAQYFLKASLKNSRVSDLKSLYNKPRVINDKLIKEFDFFLCPISTFNKLKLSKIDLITNFFSFGEMSEENFNSYQESEILKNSKYIFYINRFYSHNEYKNNLSVLNYKLNNYKKIYFDIHKMENYYIRQFYRYLGKKEKTNSQFFEFIGLNEKI